MTKGGVGGYPPDAGGLRVYKDKPARHIPRRPKTKNTRCR